MAWQVYHIAPIDFNWHFCKTVEETAEQIGKDAATAKFRDTVAEGPTIDDFHTDWKNAQQLASEAGWDGDFRGDPVVFWIPAENEFTYGFVIKHDNNGDTFVITPVDMDWLTNC